MIRIWGGAAVARGAFYDACDEAGILVWPPPASSMVLPEAQIKFLPSAICQSRMAIQYRSCCMPCLGVSGQLEPVTAWPVMPSALVDHWNAVVTAC